MPGACLSVAWMSGDDSNLQDYAQVLSSRRQAVLHDIVAGMQSVTFSFLISSPFFMHSLESD